MNGFQKKIIEHAIEEPDELSGWEWDFIFSLASRNDDYELSDKQNAVLNRISQSLGE